MEPSGYYESRLVELKAALAVEEARSSRLSLLRVVTFLLGASAIGAHLFSQTPGALAAGATLIAFFFVLVVIHARVVQREDRVKAAILFCERGLLRSRDDLGALPPRGDKKRREGHPYAGDLDLLGERSVLSLLDAMETELSEARLSDWLLSPAAPGEIAARQRAVREMAERPALLEALFVHGRAAARTPGLGSFLSWSGKPGPATGGLTALAVALPLATAGLFFGGAALGLPSWAWLVTAFLQWSLSLSLGALGASGLDEAARGSLALGAFSGVLSRLKGETFASPRLSELARRLGEASSALSRLEVISSWAEARDNGMFRLMVGPLVMYDLHLWLWLERWRKAHGAAVASWLDGLSEGLSLAGLGVFAFDNPTHCYPEITEGPLRFSAEALAHPLLPRKSRVANDVALPGPGVALLVTGSNMSGKSTLLRSVGVAAALAQAGAPVAARSLSMSPLLLRTSIRVSDSLASGYSHFYAELLAVKRVVDDARSAPVLFLLDEIFHGTNSRERQVGARAVLVHLLDHGAIGAVSTHDLGLVDLASEMPGRVVSVYLMEQHEGDQMTFDYKLRQGVLRSGNALSLMRQLGLPV